jgi:hypothetical protein
MVKTFIKAVVAYVLMMNFLLFIFGAFPPMENPFDVILAPFRVLDEPIYAVLSLGVFLASYLWALRSVGGG